MSMLLLMAVAAALEGSGGPAFHAVAFVNDSLSHGQLGDGLLSLNEAILLHNGTLAYAQLSPAEQAQLSLIPGTGSTTDVTWIDIDTSNTPVITIEQDLAPVLDTTFGLLLKGYGEPVVFDFTGPGLTRGLLVPANAMTVENAVFLGGAYGLDVVQTDVTGQAGCVLQDVRFEGQATFGLRVVATAPNGVGRVILDRCQFVNCPTAVTLDESGGGRTSIFEAYDVDIRGGAVGIEAVLGSAGSTRYTFQRVSVDASTTGIRFVRTAQADRSMYLEGSFVRVSAADCVSVPCHPNGVGTWAVLHLWQLQATPGGSALRLGRTGDRVFGELTELVLDGDVTIGAGAAVQPLQLVNARGRNGAWSLATTAAQVLTLRECRLDACSLQTGGSGPITANGCCFLGGAQVGIAAAPLQLDGCHAVAPGAFVQVMAPVATAQLGSMSIVPAAPQLGGSVQFVADLPPGLLGAFALGIRPPTGPLSLPPFQLYLDPAAYVMVPGIYQLQQFYTWSLPSSASFAGTDLVVQLAVLPLPGVPAPWLQLPPGRRFVL
ncbi:MAG: hypothetical protein MUC36_24650 [Planctomycetes bacterium]|jgi:hypothetical protein|nr:hypothetical protein [Planctomycetota bacterium]